MGHFKNLSNIELYNLYRSYKGNFGMIYNDENWKEILAEYPDSPMKQIRVIADMFEEITQRWIKSL